MITRERQQAVWTEAGVVLLPTLVVVLYSLLSLKLQTPTAGGLSFLAAALLAFYLFPRKRVRAARLMGAVLLAVVVGLLLSVLLGYPGRG